jgi:hypothetical protein
MNDQSRVRFLAVAIAARVATGPMICGCGGAIATDSEFGGGGSGGMGNAGAALAGGTSSATSTGGVATGGMGTAGIGPMCGTTSAGVPIAANSPCGAADPQVCYKTCGLLRAGLVSETCLNGAYVQDVCQYPPGPDYSCLQVPTVDSPGCPATPPQSGQPCTLTPCSLPCGTAVCEACGVNIDYIDSSGNTKDGWCVCAADASSNHWSCAVHCLWPLAHCW